MGYWEHRKEVACDEEKQQNGAEDAEPFGRITAACGVAALAMSALASCAPQESRPVVTSDDLTPPSAAQEAIAQEAGGGKNWREKLAGGKCGGNSANDAGGL